MINRAFTKTYASTIAPSPSMNCLWMDLSADPYGSVIKYFNGSSWASDASDTLVSPSLSGTPTAPTATVGTNTTQLATTGFVATASALKADKANPTFTGVISRSGTGTPATLSGLSYQAWDTVPGVFQNNIQNLSNAATASTDLVATADSGNDTTNYVDFGINGSGYSVGTWTINGALDGYLYSQSSNMAVGTSTATKNLVLFTGGTLASNARLTLSDSMAVFSGLASAPNIIEGYATTATSGASTTLVATSPYQQYFTGTLAQTVVMPVATTLMNGQQWLITNNSTGLVTINTSGASALTVLASGTSASITCINKAGGTGVASWNVQYSGASSATGKKLVSSNTLTLAGTDATTMTFPSTSAIIARADATGNAGALLHSGSAGIGYTTGAGGTVTQLTSKATAFALSKLCGTIVTAADALASQTTVTSTWTNTTIAANDIIIATHVSGGTLGAYNICVTAGAGTATVSIRNLATGPLSEAITIRYSVLKGVIA